MKTVDIAIRAGRNLRQAKTRTLLTALAISVGALTLTLSLAIGAGTRQYFATFMETNINSQALMIAKDKNLMGVSMGGGSALQEYDPTAASFGGGVSFKTLSPKDIETVAADKDIKEVSPSYDVKANYFTFEGNPKKYTSAVYTYDSTIRNEALAGNMPKLGEMINDSEIVIPEAYLKTLGVKKPEQAIGKTVTLHIERQMQQLSETEIQQIMSTEGFAGLANASKTESKDESFKIRAVSVKPSTAMTASNQLAISSNKAKELAEFITKDTKSYQQYMTGYAIVKDGADPMVVRDRLQKKGLKVMTAKDLQGMLFTLVNVMQAIVSGFGILALLASVFGIINTQYISVLERTSQIGLMKALGMSNKAIGKLFRYEAAWIGFLGGVIGALLAVISGILLNPWITKTLKLGDGNSLLLFEPIPILGLLFFLVIVAIVAGWFPSRKAARLDPIEALRTE